MIVAVVVSYSIMLVLLSYTAKYLPFGDNLTRRGELYSFIEFMQYPNWTS